MTFSNRSRFIGGVNIAAAIMTPFWHKHVFPDRGLSAGMILLALVIGIAGAGIFLRKAWAVTAGLIASLVCLVVFFPFGLFICIHTISYLFSDEARSAYGNWELPNRLGNLSKSRFPILLISALLYIPALVFALINLLVQTAYSKKWVALERSISCLIYESKRILMEDPAGSSGLDEQVHTLYLRTFTSDGSSSHSKFLPYSTTDEERIAKVMKQVGSFKAIGRPTESKPGDLGADRLYFSNDKWQNEVIRMMKSAQLVILNIDPELGCWPLGNPDEIEMTLFKIPDKREAIWWEVEQVILNVKPERLLFHLPFHGDQEKYESFSYSVERSFPSRFPKHLGNACFLAFKPDWTPYLIEAAFPSFFGAIVQHGRTLQPVLATLGINQPKICFDLYRVVELLIGLLAIFLGFVAILAPIIKLLELLKRII